MLFKNFTIDTADRMRLGVLPPPMTFIRKQHVLNRDVALLQILDYLFRFNHGHVGIVRTMQDDRGSFYPIDARERRKLSQHLRLLVGVSVLIFEIAAIQG